MLEGRAVLILEDEPVIGFALEDIVETIGGRVCGTAFRVAEALDMLRQHQCDAAILDVNIAGERSYPVADALAARNIPFIFATGYGDSEHPSRFAHAPTVTKPYGVEDIRVALARALFNAR
ncbi:response regulator [Sphingomonas sp. ID1715]|uniref:response regulator n=1 Tax=Sphingomonas sp. ID1715 TaxID=1656898 RepID=UPI0014883884|nr:response regulator [Sphingomonas sp. ID1715]NNM75959.1 response regulator [Sphingomonas sp. ID1715]